MAGQRYRIFNSTTPFSTATPKDLKSSYESFPSPREDIDRAGEGAKLDNLTYLTQVLTQGTAKHVGTGLLGSEKPSPFIAQAVCENSQEFSPTCPERYVSPRLLNRSNNVACASTPTPAPIPNPAGSSPRRPSKKKRQKRQRRRQGEREGQQREGGSDGRRERALTGVPEQESGESLTQQEGASECRCSTESSSVQETECPSYTPQVGLSWGTCSSTHPWRPLLHPSTPPLRDLPSYAQESRSSVGCDGSDSPLSSVGNCTLALAGLRMSVSQGDRCYATPFIKAVKEEDEKEEEEEEKSVCDDINEGLLFNENLQLVDYEYREGREYDLCDLIKQGSYGDVYSVRDTSSGFRCAAKKILLSRFSSEEVGSWSALHSPRARVVELFGMVREGPFITLFMELKSGSVGQLLEERGRLPEDLSLHYHCQVLVALEYLQRRRVLHLDIKADNVLLSEDGKDTFLCDFGYSERLDRHGMSISTSQGLSGTETHMSPEVAQGERRGAKADIWSSCCMLLHMLSGCQPWARYYSRPLFFKIATEPPPLREIPPDCSRLTADVIKAGLQKEPDRRASAQELRVKAEGALREVGGLRSPVRGGAYQEPLKKPERPGPAQPITPTPRPTATPGHAPSSDGSELRLQGMSSGRKRREDEEKEQENVNQDAEDEEGEEENSALGSQLLVLAPPPEQQTHKMADPATRVSEQELHKLERDFFLNSLSQPHSAELQEQLLSCLSSDCPSSRELWEKKDSGRWSVTPGDDLSSGVFSYSSQPDGQSFSMDWLGPAHLPPPRCFEGVDVCIQDFNGRSIRIRETPRVKVGHIARGISDQISTRVFSLQCEDGRLVTHDEEVQESGLFLRCVPAPNCNHTPFNHSPDCSQAWSWRIREGVLETRD